MRTQSHAFGNSSPSPSPTAEPITTPSPSSGKFSSWDQKLHNTLDEETNKALVSVLLFPRHLIKFGDICKGQESIFGEPNSAEQKKVRNQRDFLLKLQQEDPAAFLELAKGFGFLKSDSQASPQSQGEEPDFAQTPAVAVIPALSVSITPPSIPLITPTKLLPFAPQMTCMTSNRIVLPHGTARSQMRST